MGWYAIRVVPRRGIADALKALRRRLEDGKIDATVEMSEKPTVLLLQAPRLSASLIEAVLKTPNIIGFAMRPPRALSEGEFLDLRRPGTEGDASVFEQGSSDLDESTLRALNGPSWARSQRRVAVLMWIFTAALFALFWIVRGK